MDLDPDDFRALFDAAPLPMYVAERGTLQILSVNRAMCERYGWTREEFLGFTLRDIRPPEEMARFEQSYVAAKSPAESYSRSARHRTKSGKIVDVTLEIASVTLGGREASLAIVTDVTGIAEADRRFRLLVEHSSEGIAVTDEANRVEYVSPGGLKILGYPAEVVLGRSSVGRTHPDDAERWTAPPPGETRYHVARLRHRDGSWRWIESSTTNLTHDPAVRAYVSNYRDITERKLAELAVERSELNFRTLIERAPAATFVHRAGHCVYANPAAVAMLGYQDAGEVVGRPIAQLIDPDVTRMMRADGSSIEIEAEQLLADFDGEPSTLVMAHDVTERNRMFERMSLADRMVTVGTLAAGVAHEINNPLAYVAANLETLAAELPALAVTPRSRLTERTLTALVGDAREGVARMSAVVRDLRSLSRLDEQTRGPIDVVAVLRSSLKMAHNEIRHRAQVVADFADDVPRVEADGSRLGQVFLNLLINAAQAIPEGHATDHTIELRVALTPDRANVRIDIRDTGVGIAPEVMRRIFDPFFTTKAPGIGTGLGLSISHQIVRAMDGELRVDSAPGAGSMFSVILPVAGVAREAEAAGSPPPAPVSARVLLVDDEAALGRSLAMLLAPETDVVAVTSAGDALARLTSGERYDAILCDLMMPEVSGIELYHRIAELVPEYTMRIVFMTGGAFTTQAREFLATFPRPHLDKPFSEAQLRQALATVIG